MRARHFHIVWGMVICLTAVTVGLLPGSEPPQIIDREVLIETERFPESPVVVIGSSLMRYAVPATGSATDSLLDDGRSHVRLALSTITEKETLTALARVLAPPVECVFVEIQPLGMDFSYQRTPDRFFERTLLHIAVDRIRLFSRNSKRELGRKSGWRSTMDLQPREQRSMTEEPSKLDATFQTSSVALRQVYPIHLRSPRELDRLQQLLDKANEQHIKIVLVAPPRSQTAVNYIGDDFAESLERHFQNLARQLDLPLFQPARSWPDEFFVDHAHMNRRGRERFCRELARWSSTRS
ncbi:MAG: hypothetical protein ACKVII_27430 [Planctomycetales bacterium]|jgi:hypothetical protein